MLVHYYIWLLSWNQINLYYFLKHNLNDSSFHKGQSNRRVIIPHTQREDVLNRAVQGMIYNSCQTSNQLGAAFICWAPSQGPHDKK